MSRLAPEIFKGKDRRVFKRRFWISLVLCVVAVGLAVFARVAPADAESLLGLPLPPSASEVQVSLQRDIFGVFFQDFRGYVRFELSPHDAQSFMNSDQFQNVQTTTYPQGIMGNAVSGSTPVAELARANQPLWWLPESGGDFLVGYRSFQPSPLTQTGVDFAWYMIDMSNPAQATAYVYLLEV